MTEAFSTYSEFGMTAKVNVNTLQVSTNTKAIQTRNRLTVLES